MKYLTCFILAVVLSLLLGLCSPWWSVVIGPFLAGFLFSLKPGTHILLGFLSIFSLWGIQAFVANQAHAADLVMRIGQLFQGLSPVLLILISALIGGLYGCLAQLSGHLLKSLLKNEK